MSVAYNIVPLLMQLYLQTQSQTRNAKCRGKICSFHERLGAVKCLPDDAKRRLLLTNKNELLDLGRSRKCKHCSFTYRRCCNINQWSYTLRKKACRGREDHFVSVLLTLFITHSCGGVLKDGCDNGGGNQAVIGWCRLHTLTPSPSSYQSAWPWFDSSPPDPFTPK